jgi:hypothetical protein
LDWDDEIRRVENSRVYNFTDDVEKELFTKNKLWRKRWFGMASTILGIILMAIITGIIVDSIRAKMEYLKKGIHIHIQETGHVIMIGWTDKSITIIKELSLANSNRLEWPHDSLGSKHYFTNSIDCSCCTQRFCTCIVVRVLVTE